MKENTEESKPKINLYIDVFSSCNLKCPTCPVGNWPGKGSHSKGFMEEDLLSLILEKALRECELTSVGLYNWTEPLLNPALPKLVKVVKSFGQWCAISSNLNTFPHVDEIMEAKPDWFRISVSGFYQKVYELGHRGGDIEKVKKNMRILAEARDRNQTHTDVEIFFHKYLDNQEDEFLMREYAESLGFRFVPAWAYMMPVEKVLAYVDPDYAEKIITDEDLISFSRFALPTKEAVKISSEHRLNSCVLQESSISLDVKGNVYLCCAASARRSNILGNYMDMSIKEIHVKMKQHSMCESCMKYGLIDYFNHDDSSFDEIGDRERTHYQNKIQSEKMAIDRIK